MSQAAPQELALARQRQSGIAVSTRRIFFTNISLPAATVQSAYQTVLLVRGGTSPYQFRVTRGSLPSGLALNTKTGAIAGTPTASGVFSFTVRVTDLPRLDAGDRLFSISVATSPKPPAPITVSVSPTSASLVSGGSQQFQANVSGSSQTGVTWKTTAGTISSSGLLTAPAVSTNTNVIVTATSVAAASQSASAAVVVSPKPAAPITVSISPPSANVVSGGSQQFQASVSGTSQTAVTWKTTAGTISSSGLFTAPSVSATTFVTVTATSVAAVTQGASAAVSVSPKAPVQSLIITSTGIPPAFAGTSYQTNLSAAGGQTPYQWKLVGGALPPGISLVSSGAIAGTTSSTGTFNFTVQVLDSAQGTASAALVLQVGAASSCGPPTYNCSRADLNPAPNPAVPPQVGPHACVAGQLTSCGNLTGANTVVVDPDFHSRIVRVTDSTTAGGATLTASSSGSSDVNMWNHDSTMFLVQDTAAAAYLFGFNPSTMQASRVAAMPYMPGGSSWSWSFVNPAVLYRLVGTALYSYDLTGVASTIPAPKLIYDFNNGQCMSADPLWTANPTITWHSQLSISTDDQTFASGFSNAGGQGTGFFNVTYTVGKGCRMLDSKSGTVYGTWGQTGTINIPDRWTIHLNILGKGGDWDIVGFTTCLSASCSQPPYFWDVATTNISNPSGCLSGHWTEGHSHWMNNSGCNHIGQSTLRQFALPGLSTLQFQLSQFPSNMVLPFDQHFSWNNVDPSDSYPFLSSSWTTVNPLPAAWYNEILGTFPVSIGNTPAGTIKRFAHSFITGKSQRFNTMYAIGHVSQDGKFFMFSSDWLGTLGAEGSPGSAACTIGTNCRGDVFVVELK